jgi:transcriptional regulator with XRE-family HTH domain
VSASGSPFVACATSATSPQDELGYRAGLHRNYVSEIERGKRNPTLTTVERIAAAFEVAPSVLIAQAEQGPVEAGDGRSVRTRQLMVGPNGR